MKIEIDFTKITNKIKSLKLGNLIMLCGWISIHFAIFINAPFWGFLLSAGIGNIFVGFLMNQKAFD